MNLYRDIIISHYKNPLNKGHLEHFTHEAFKANTTCGDEITMQILLEEGAIKEIKFNGKGCAISQASCSLLTDYLIGQSLTESLKINFDDILEMIGGGPISPARIKCAKLGLDVFKKALSNQ